MVALVNKLQPFGDVLEIGFGLGYSASEIQKRKIKSHTIIECDKTVYQTAQKWQMRQKQQVNLVFGKWQDCIHALPKFDCIFLDDAPTSDAHHDMNNEEFYWFLNYAIRYLAKAGTKITWYADNAISYLVPPFTRFEMTAVPMQIDPEAKYVDSQNEAMFAPLLTVLEIPKIWPRPLAISKFGLVKVLNV